MDRELTSTEKKELHREVNKILGNKDCKTYFHILVAGESSFHLGLDLNYNDAQKLREDIWLRVYNIIGIVLDLVPKKETEKTEKNYRHQMKNSNSYEKNYIRSHLKKTINSIENEYKPKILKIILLAIKEFILFRGSNIDENKYRSQLNPLAKIIEREKWNTIINKNKVATRLNIYPIECEKYHIPFSPTDNYHITQQKLLNLKIQKKIVQEILTYTFDKTSYRCSKELRKYQVEMYKLQLKNQLEYDSFSNISKSMLSVKQRLKAGELAYLPDDAFYMFDVKKEKKHLEFSKYMTITIRDAGDEENDEEWQKHKGEFEEAERKKYKKFY